MDVLIGVDVGQKRDPTAICVAELEWRGGNTAGRDDHYIVRYLDRLPLGTAYPDVADEIVRIRNRIVQDLAKQPQPADARVTVSGAGAPQGAASLNGDRGVEIRQPLPPSHPTITLYVDATGVGQPVVDLLAAKGAHPLGCYFVHGERRTKFGREVRLGKAWMVSRLQVLAQSGRVHLPRTKEAEATRSELLDYEIRVSDDGHDTYGAFRTGKHDDLVTALGLATQAPPAAVYVY